MPARCTRSELRQRPRRAERPIQAAANANAPKRKRWKSSGPRSDASTVADANTAAMAQN